MHEFSIMSLIVDAVKTEASKRNATKVESVTIDIGEFTMLGDEQMRFAFDVLAKDTMMDGATLVIREVKGEIECTCGFRGHVSPEDDAPHRGAPVLECPKCGGGATVVGGRECIIRDIKLVVPDV
jgi:hydrogenase nickel incorporation protein HypA/HybF